MGGCPRDRRKTTLLRRLSVVGAADLPGKSVQKCQCTVVPFNAGIIKVYSSLFRMRDLSCARRSFAVVNNVLALRTSPKARGTVLLDVKSLGDSNTTCRKPMALDGRHRNNSSSQKDVHRNFTSPIQPTFSYGYPAPGATHAPAIGIF